LANTQNQNQQEDITLGTGIALAFILLAIFFYFYPQYFGNVIVSYVVSATLIIFGSIGLGIELNKIFNKDKGVKLDDLGVGLGLLLLWGIVHYFFPYTWVNVIMFFPLALGLVAIMKGIVSILMALSRRESTESWIVTISLAVAQIATTIVTVYEMLKKLDLMK